MKYLKFMLLLIIITACEKNWTVEQIIENSTEHSIMIKTYEQGEELDIINVAPNNSYTKTSIKEPRNTDDMFLLNILADSVNIVFDNEKIITQSCNNSSLMYCPDVERNILNLIEYEKEDTGTHSISYTYIIKEEDYYKAIPISIE